ncbi:MAG: hypothetical protein EA428_01850 [Spirochaetaceae bacterium]|nr:MAG: hypothetical protein EA428_01850 [Spirochaetaceae bacterium]
MNTHTPNQVSLDGPSDTPLIMVTNDDGIFSPGLLAAVEGARLLGDVVVAAPTTQQTAMGRSLRGNPKDFFHAVELPLDPAAQARAEAAGLTVYPVAAFHIDATPALVVRHALSALCPLRRPDMVISGINFGENLGNNITLSGTVGAALQAAAAGIPAIAASRQTEVANHFEYVDLDWTDATRVVLDWARRVLALVLSSRAESAQDGRWPFELYGFDVLKVDVPDPCPPGTEERFTTLASVPYFLSHLPTPRADAPIEDAQTYINADREHLSPSDDIYAMVVDRVVSVTPLNLDNGVSPDKVQKLIELP